MSSVTISYYDAVLPTGREAHKAVLVLPLEFDTAVVICITRIVSEPAILAERPTKAILGHAILMKRSHLVI